MNKVIVDFNVFGSGMKDWICNEIDGKHIITSKRWNMPKRKTQFL